MSGPLAGFGVVLARDLRLAFHRPGEMANPLLFFILITAIFPLGLSPEPELLRTVAPGILWGAALLSSLLALDLLFRSDYEDGSLEQLVLSGHSLPVLVLAKTLAHWMVSGLPLVLVAPLLASALYLPAEAWGTLMLGLLLGTPTLSLLGAMGAALTTGLGTGSALLSLLVLPLATPILIFGARGVDLAVQGMDPVGPLYLLAAILFLALSLLPLAIATAVRISLD
ncbi:MAG: heme exporter protein CcmB [Proteobacteria bacterium]|nr:heme exporter protein CcmB [Pseudomonadota bacterium]